MRIAIGHYHLQTGGVTRVIEHTCAALTAAGHQVLVIAGEPPPQPLPEPIDLAVVRQLAYEEHRSAGSPAELAAELTRAAHHRLGTLPDLWHFHNHCLGKNLILPGALLILARQGQRLLLQPHDFAEDGRPGLYARQLAAIGGGDAVRLSGVLYPLAAHVHYAVLNGRDRGFLAAAGVVPEHLHLLPNAVSLSAPRTQPASPFSARRLWLYPTRAIRRKNLGEFLLWATLAEDPDLLATTQAPRNPLEQARYRKWVALAEDLNLPMEFALGESFRDFPALLACAHALVTTSVAEGFGLAFLEPWLVGRPLAGRNLPEITRDFAATGLDLRGLYERIDVPLQWLDQGRLRSSMDRALKAVMNAYGREAKSADLERLWASAARDGCIDFGRLDETAQEEVIRHLAAARHDRASLRPASLRESAALDLIAHNRGVAEQGYSIGGYGQRLEAVYRSLLDSPIDAHLGAADGAALLDRFLAPERLFLLRT